MIHRLNFKGLHKIAINSENQKVLDLNKIILEKIQSAKYKLQKYCKNYYLGLKI